MNSNSFIDYEKLIMSSAAYKTDIKSAEEELKKHKITGFIVEDIASAPYINQGLNAAVFSKNGQRIVVVAGMQSAREVKTFYVY